MSEVDGYLDDRDLPCMRLCPAPPVGYRNYGGTGCVVAAVLINRRWHPYVKLLRWHGRSCLLLLQSPVAEDGMRSMNHAFVFFTSPNNRK